MFLTVLIWLWKPISYQIFDMNISWDTPINHTSILPVNSLPYRESQRCLHYLEFRLAGSFFKNSHTSWYFCELCFPAPLFPIWITGLKMLWLLVILLRAFLAKFVFHFFTSFPGLSLMPSCHVETPRFICFPSFSIVLKVPWHRGKVSCT